MTNIPFEIHNVFFGKNSNDKLHGGNKNDAIYGLKGNDLLHGFDGQDYLEGNEGDDTLNGGADKDILFGGAGNDTYYVDNKNDTIIETLAQHGIDRVISSVNFQLQRNIENLTLTGKENLEGYGNELNNVIIGNAGDNYLLGFSGNDTIRGGAGGDYMVGGSGDDIYYVDHYDDLVLEFEAAEGTDRVISSLTYKLGRFVEHLTLTGESNLVGYGNELNNVIIGNHGNNYLYGYGGNDTLRGGTGADYMSGGYGDDTYYVDNNGDVVAELEAEAGKADRVISSINVHELNKYVENLTLTGEENLFGYGNKLDNIIAGNAGHNLLYAGDGNDRINAAAGDDRVYGDRGNDVINGGAGFDSLDGGAGNDTINGGKDNDIINGGYGDDLLVKAVDEHDTFVFTVTNSAENAGISAGTDTIRNFNFFNDEIDILINLDSHKEQTVKYGITYDRQADGTLDATLIINGNGSFNGNIVTITLENLQLDGINPPHASDFDIDVFVHTSQLGTDQIL